MSWSTSKVFRAWVADQLSRTTTQNYGTDVPKVALYNNTPTPDENASSANSAYNVGQWVTAQEVFQAGQWAQGGVALSGTSGTTHFSDTANAVWYDANDTSSGTAATLAGVFGCQVYDDTLTTPVADQGMSFHYFGGTQTVTGGQFTVVWNVNGIQRYTM